MRIDAAFPSDYIKAADLNGTPRTLQMSHVAIEKVGNEQKPVLYFRNAKKGLVLNKTNSNVISQAYGVDTEEWIEREIELFETMAEFNGKQVPAIRVRLPRARTQPHAPAQRAPIPASAEADDSRWEAEKAPF